jgi:hypothetical protein
MTRRGSGTALAVSLLVLGCEATALRVDRSAPDGAASSDAPALAEAALPLDQGRTSAEVSAPADAAVAPDDVGVAPADAAVAPDGLAGGAWFAVTWQVQWFGSSQPVSCAEAGTPTVLLRATDTADRTTTDRFDCAALTGQTRLLAPGTYLFDLSIEDERGQRIGYSTWHFDLLAGQTNDLGLQAFEVQSFLASWRLLRAGQPTTCAAAGARSVELVARRAAEPAITFSFPCADGKAATKAIAQGDYLVEARLLGAAGETLARTAAVPVEAGDEKRATVPPLTFDLAP